MLEVGLIGTGYGAEIQAQALQVNRAFSLLGVASQDYKSSKRVKKEVGFRYAFSDWQELVRYRKTDIVLVASPPQTHYEIIYEALQHQKHVLTTAPFVLNVEQAEELSALANEHEVMGVVDHHLNYLPARKYAINLIKSGKIGKLKSVNRIFRNSGGLDRNMSRSWKFQMQNGGGAFWQYASHDIDYLLRAVGGVNMIRYDGVQNISDRINPEGFTEPVKCDDSGTVLLRFHNGAKATVNIDTTYPGKPVNEFVFHGEHGLLHLKNDNELFLYHQDGSRDRVAIPPSFQITTIPGAAARSPFYMLSEAFAAAIYGQGKVSPTFDEAVHTQRAMNAALRSEEQDNWVEVGADVITQVQTTAQSGSEVHKIFE